MTQTNLTPSQRKVLRYIARYKRDSNGLAPSYRDIMRNCGYASTSAVAHVLGTLEALGHVQIGRAEQWRAIWLPGEVYQLPPDKELAQL